MARIKIDIHGKRLTTINVPVRITDLNYGNHVGNDSFVSIIHDARMQWLRQHRFSEINAGGTGLIMSDLALEFKSECFYGDDLTIDLYAADISRYGFDILYELTTKRNDQTVLIAKAKTGMIFFDYETKKVALIPEKLSSLLKDN